MDCRKARSLGKELAQDFSGIVNAEAQGDGSFELPLLMLDDQVVFPEVLCLVPLLTEAQVQAAAVAYERGGTLIACKLRAKANGGKLFEQIHAVGTEIAPGKTTELESGNAQLLAQGRRRVEIISVWENGAYPVAKARELIEEPVEAQGLESLAKALVELFKHSSQYNEATPDSVIKHILSLEDPGRLGDSLAAIMTVSGDDLQQLLELDDIEKRLELLAVLLTSDLQDNEIHDEVHSRLQDEIAANQREMYLREQVRVIQQELGDGDVFQQEIHELTEKIRQAELPGEVHEKAMKELSRLGVIPPMSPESGVIHTYLDRLLTLPWNAVSEENLDLEQCRRDSRWGALWAAQGQGADNRTYRGAQVGAGQDEEPDIVFCGTAGRGQDIARQEHRGCAGLQILANQLGGRARRSRDTGPSANVYWLHAGANLAADGTGGDGQPGLHAGRDRQDEFGLPRRSRHRPCSRCWILSRIIISSTTIWKCPMTFLK